MHKSMRCSSPSFDRDAHIIRSGVCGKNIFDTVVSIRPVKDFNRHAFCIIKLKRIVLESPWTYTTVLDYVNTTGFSCWKNRGRCVDASDFLQQFGYTELWYSAENIPTDFFTLV